MRVGWLVGGPAAAACVAAPLPAGTLKLPSFGYTLNFRDEILFRWQRTVTGGKPRPRAYPQSSFLPYLLFASRLQDTVTYREFIFYIIFSFRCSFCGRYRRGWLRNGTEADRLLFRVVRAVLLVVCFLPSELLGAFVFALFSFGGYPTRMWLRKLEG